ncbi:MAG: hypothetical protein ACUVTM_07875 [Candidatus Bathyarchaeia archaeon]
MRIGMMTPWNANSGPSICAELTGRQWVRNGYKLKVFAHDGSNKPDGMIIQEDEDYVERCFGTSYWGRMDWLNPRPILNYHPEVFIVHNLAIMPMSELAKIYGEVRKDSVTIMVIHEGYLPEDPLFYDFEWDAIICFDERYVKLFSKIYSKEKIHIIPFPYHPIMGGDKYEARLSLNLPLNRKIILFFGYSVWRNLPLIPALEEVNKTYPLHVLVLTTDQGSISGFTLASAKVNLPIEIRREAPPLSRLYRYLHAADVLVKHVEDRPGEENITLSSTVHLCLGSECPIMVSDAKIFETLKDQVLKYPAENLGEFKAQLVKVLTGDKVLHDLRRAVRRCIAENSASKIAGKYIDLFKSLR